MTWGDPSSSTHYVPHYVLALIIFHFYVSLFQPSSSSISIKSTVSAAMASVSIPLSRRYRGRRKMDREASDSWATLTYYYSISKGAAWSGMTVAQG